LTGFDDDWFFLVLHVVLVLGKGLLGVAHPIKAESCGVFSNAYCLLLGRPRVSVEGKGDLVLGLVSSGVDHVTGEGN
jgi:hypothetical protein